MKMMALNTINGFTVLDDREVEQVNGGTDSCSGGCSCCQQSTADQVTAVITNPIGAAVKIISQAVSKGMSAQ
jgi:hypothetical protein